MLLRASTSRRRKRCCRWHRTAVAAAPAAVEHRSRASAGGRSAAVAPPLASAGLERVGRDEPAQRALTRPQRTIDLDPGERPLLHLGGWREQGLAEVEIVSTRTTRSRSPASVEIASTVARSNGRASQALIISIDVDVRDDVSRLFGADLRRGDDGVCPEADRGEVVAEALRCHAPLLARGRTASGSVHAAGSPASA